jgi:hypothetical protein
LASYGTPSIKRTAGFSKQSLLSTVNGQVVAMIAPINSGAKPRKAEIAAFSRRHSILAPEAEFAPYAPLMQRPSADHSAHENIEQYFCARPSKPLPSATRPRLQAGDVTASQDTGRPQTPTWASKAAAPILELGRTSVG